MNRETTEVDHHFAKKKAFSDECHSHLDGYVNLQNLSALGLENLHQIHECTLKKLQKIEDQTGHSVTVSGERYRNLLGELFLHQLNDMEWDTTAELKNEFMHVIFQIDPFICKDVIENLPKRTRRTFAWVCNLTDIIFYVKKSSVYTLKTFNNTYI